MTRKTLLLTLSTLSFSLLTSCHMRTPKQESWFNPKFEGYTLGKTTVLAIAESEVICRQYETFFVDRLLPYVEAGSLRASMPVPDKIEKEKLDALLKENNVKTIIITHVLGENNRDELVTIGYTATPYNSGYYGYYSYGYSLSANMASVSSYMEYVLETNVYDVESGELIWSGRKAIFDDRSNAKNMELITSNVIRDLEKRGLLK